LGNLQVGLGHIDGIKLAPPEEVAFFCWSWKVPWFKCLKCLKFKVPKVKELRDFL